MSPRAFRWLLLGLVALALLATLVIGSLAESPARVAVLKRPAGPPPVLGRAPEFSLLNRDGRKVTSRDLAGEVWVADFIFTRCASSCPRMTALMARLGAEAPGLRRVSFSVDPAYDTPEVLTAYAAAAQRVDDPRWLFLTGPPATIEAVVAEGFKLPIVTSPPSEMARDAEPILHSDRFVLVDAEGAVRGYYEATDRAEYERLLADVGSLRNGEVGPEGVARRSEEAP